MNVNLLRGEIVSHGKTMSGIASEIGISKNAMSAKMNGHSNFNLDEVVRLCDVLGITDPAKKSDIFLS